MPLVKSRFGSAPDYPTQPAANIHDAWFGEPLPALLDVPDDFVVFVDAISGRRLTYGEFQASVSEVATAVTAGVEGHWGTRVPTIQDGCQ